MNFKYVLSELCEGSVSLLAKPKANTRSLSFRENNLLHIVECKYIPLSLNI